MPLCRTGELADLWKQCRLRDVSEQAIEITMRFASFADCWDPFLLGQRPAGSYARRLGADKLRALRSEVKHQLSVTARSTPVDLARGCSACGETVL